MVNRPNQYPLYPRPPLRFRRYIILSTLFLCTLFVWYCRLSNDAIPIGPPPPPPPPPPPLVNSDETCRGRSLLVTGLPRSGTTVTGYLSSLLDHQWMVHEPSNPSNINGVLGGRFRPSANAFPFGDSQFPDVSSWDDSKPATLYYDAILETFCSAPDDDGETLVVIKDPTFLSSAEWLIQDYGVGHALVMIRHPAAVVASWKALGWEGGSVPRLATLYNDMMSDYVVPLWMSYRDSPRWLFLRHEDLCRDPIGVTLRIHQVLLSESVDSLTVLKERALPYTRAPTTSTGRHQYHAVHMDTAAQVGVWKEELTTLEVNSIRIRTAPVWHHFYTEEDW